MNVRQEVLIGWFGIVLNILCVIVFESTGLADDIITGSFVYNLIGCIVWLVGLGLNFPLLLLLDLIWFAIPLSIWAIHVLGILCRDGYGGQRSYSFFWSAVFILVLSAIYDYWIFKIYFHLRKSRQSNKQIITSNPPSYTSASLTKAENV
ncbi:uncharacterized protein LOC116348075 [Contarinia nasturtii]|uniref:uncharacterized protein LOC116348075 n=1 Tax=Contarinia nasturtii TaxID=265458 RepID=UPI0012D3A4ED|nr:uncharacterized protein LOC116348075 [Contarinia nasturtii]